MVSFGEDAAGELYVLANNGRANTANITVNRQAMAAAMISACSAMRSALAVSPLPSARVRNSVGVKPVSRLKARLNGASD